MTVSTRSSEQANTRRYLSVVWISLSLLLASCGGSSGETAGGPTLVSPVPVDPIVNTMGPGEFRSATWLKSFTAEVVTNAVRDSAGAVPSVAPKYTVNTYRLEYLTLGAQGLPVLASALIAIPAKASTSVSPVLSYQHGTLARDAEAPSNQVLASEIPVLMASVGYIALAPDFVGYGASKGQLHPYLLAAPSASMVMDLLTAAKYWRQTQGVRDNKQLFLAGYSEGAYVTMAAARAMEASASVHNQNLVAAVTGAGPYQVQITLDELLKRIRDQNALLGALVNPGLLRYLGAGVRASVRNELINQLLGANADVVFDSTLIDNFLADDTEAIARQSNVHDWRPAKPIRLFHGPQDQTVSYLSSSATVQAMQANAAGSLVHLTDCTAQPSSHLGCVPEFRSLMVKELGDLARDL